MLVYENDKIDNYIYSKYHNLVVNSMIEDNDLT